MDKTLQDSNEKKPAVDYYKVMIGRFHSFLDSRTDSQKKRLLIVWSIIAVLLIAVSCIPLPYDFRILSALVGTPAGVIVWFIFAGLFNETKLADSKLATLKSEYSPARRKRYTLIGAGLFVVLAIFASPFLPYGIGGVLAVVAALFCFYFLSKTDEEKKLDEYGLPDPRDYEEFYREMEEEMEAEYDEDNDEYYDDIEDSRR